MSFAQTFSGNVRVWTGSSGVNAGKLFQGTLSQLIGETLRIIGATALSTLTTGLNTGTAGTGTSATSVAKPTGAANWTASNLVGKWWLWTGGAGASADGSPILRPILSNTTTTLAINAVPGIDNTTTFQIVDLKTQVDEISGSDLNGIRAAGMYGPIEIFGLDFSTNNALDSLISLSDCTDVKVSACNVGINCANPSVYIQRCGKVKVEHCLLSASGDVAIIDGCRNVNVTGCVNSAGGVIEIDDFVKLDVVGLTASSSPSRVLSVIRGVSANIEVSASNGGATPVYLESIHKMTASGTGLVGTGNTGYGVEFAVSGNYNLTGCSITGTTNDVLFDGVNPGSWALELGTTYGRMATATMGLTAQTVPTKTLLYGNFLFNGSGDHSSRELYYSIFNPAQNTGITAAGTVVGNAFQLPAGEFYRIDTCASGAGAKFHNAAALPGVRIMTYNNAANACILYPGNGGTINGSSSFSLGIGVIKTFICVDYGADKWVSL